LPQTVSACFIGTHDLYQPFQTKATLNCLPTPFQRSPEIKDLELPIGFSKFRVVPDKLDLAQRTRDAKDSCRW